jgi:hypothetical protein
VSRLIRALPAAVACCIWLATSASAQVYTFRGTSTCTKSGCHAKEKEWSEKEDGPPPNGHRNAFEQLTREPEKTKKYAASIGLQDPQDAAGRCVECHAPPQRSRFRDGVSCEVCHGAGSGYYDPHDDDPYKTNGYPKALKLGMAAFLDSPNVWAQRCMSCHVVRESKLTAAGHPSGDDFDLAAKYQIVRSANGNHWKANYAARTDEIKRLARQFGDPIRMARSRDIAAPPPPTPPVPPPSPAPPSPVPPPPPPPPPVIDSTPPAPPPVVQNKIEPPASAVPQPKRVQPGNVNPGTMASRGRGSAPAAPSAPTPPVPQVQTPPPPMYNPNAVIATLPRSPAALVAAIQGRAIELMNSLLMRGATAPVVGLTTAAPPYGGPDTELLRLQQEALKLAIEALGNSPRSASPPPQR